MPYETPLRVVVWADGTAAAAHAAGWAAAHAAARALPLHVVHIAEYLASADAGGGATGGAGFAARNRTAMDVAQLAQEMTCIHDLRPELTVTAEIAAHSDPNPGGHPPTEPGDLVVTGAAGYLLLTADLTGAAQRQPPVPVVVVSDRPGSRTAREGTRCRILLLTGPRLSPGSADFAFRTAADLGATLDVVRVAPQGGTFGDDYWVEPGRSAYRAEPRMQHEMARLRARFPSVPGVVAILRTRPWATLRAMARNAHLAVVGGGPDAAQDLNVLLKLGVCAVAVVPDA